LQGFDLIRERMHTERSPSDLAAERVMYHVNKTAKLQSVTTMS
jgi:hypothetical protein